MKFIRKRKKIIIIIIIILNIFILLYSNFHFNYYPSLCISTPFNFSNLDLYLYYHFATLVYFDLKYHLQRVTLANMLDLLANKPVKLVNMLDWQVSTLVKPVNKPD